MIRSFRRQEIRRFARVGAIAMLGMLGLWCVGRLSSTHAQLQEGAIPPHWIWYPTDHPRTETRYFRNTFSNKEPGSKLTLDVTADNTFILYLDGKQVAEGTDWKMLKHVEAKLPSGDHVLAAVATNELDSPAGFLVRGVVQPLGQVARIHTDTHWKVTDKVPPGDGWTKVGFDDSAWIKPRDLGVLGIQPWTGLVEESGDASERFKVPAGFQVSMVAAPSVTGSAIAFNFDPQGRPCVSVERGPIARLVDTDKDGRFDERTVIAPQMNNCQGFSFIRDCLYCVGDGPQGTGIYRLRDTDGDGVYEATEVVRLTDGGMGEHGPHAIMLGPDGCLYYNNGNHAHLKPPIDPASPANVAYEGEVLPHYNDSRGHAAGILSPCGEIYRSADDGKTWERVISGFRNHYDFAINRDGELFSFDSDMEWDLGLPWYRPVRVTHSTPGADHGSRNGSGAMPATFFDTLPPVHDVGRGSPTGVTFYQGNAFPHEYDDAFLICDWSQGRILAITLKRKGATYEAQEKELVSGQPLNCTDIEVGPDGAVYFTTGGRGTMGGLYRVAWTGAKPTPKPSDPVIEALTIASPLSSFSRARLAQIRRELRDEFGQRVIAVARNANETASRRGRALDLLIEFEPTSAPDRAVIELAKDRDPAIRAQAVRVLGMRGSEPAHAAIIEALADPDPLVKRRACEAIVRAKMEIPVERVVPLLGDSDRFVRYAARIAIEHAGRQSQKDALRLAKGTRPQLEAMLAVVRTWRTSDATRAELLTAELDLLNGPLDRVEKLDILRLMGLTITLGSPLPIDKALAAQIRTKLMAEFPTRDMTLNRELARLLALVGGPKVVDALLQAQAAEPDRPTQIHYAYCLRVLKEGWSPAAKQRFWAWLETASRWDGGFSYLGYLDFMVQDVLPQFTAEERVAYLALGSRFPFPTRVLLRQLAIDAQPERINDIAALYATLGTTTNPGAANELRGVILEKLGQSPRPEARAALHDVARADPSRRDLVARALAAHPTVDDLPILVAALESRDPNTTSTALNALRRIDQTPAGSQALRNLIRLARRTGPPILPLLDELASKWTGASPTPRRDFASALKAWESHYAKLFPDGPSLDLGPTGQNAYSMQSLLSDVLQSGLAKRGSPERGKAVLVKAKCLDCHKLGDQGQGLGPDLTTVSSRFRPHEILESMVEPSKVISDQYKSTTIATTDGKVLNGMPAGGDATTIVLLLSDGTKVTIAKSDIDEQKESKISVMPEGLLNTLTLQEIADMLALLDAQPRVEQPPAASGSKK